MLEDKILNDYREAMKAKNAIKVSTLSFLRAAMQNLAIDKKKEKLDDSDVIAIIKRQLKQRRESIEQFERGGRTDLADKERKEIEALKVYLPEELPAEELRKIIEEAIAATGASGPKDMGKVMKEVASKVAGRADGKLVSDLVKERLTRAAG